MADEKKTHEFALNGKLVNLAAVLPLTIGDLKSLKAAGTDLVKKGSDLGLEDLAALALHLCRKSNPEITAADVESMPINWMTRIGALAASAAAEDIPF